MMIQASPSRAHQIQCDIISFLRDQGAAADDLDAQTDLLAMNVLDSLTLMDLVVYLEGRYGVQFFARDISPQYFRPPLLIADCVENKLQASGAA
jgi:acyl carrier protein